jgi:DNA mismatch repair protein MSH4
MQVGLAAFDMRTASLHLSQYIETSRSYMSTLTLLHFFDPVEIIVPPKGSVPHGISCISEHFKQSQARKVIHTVLIPITPGSQSKIYDLQALLTQIILARGCFDDTKVMNLRINLCYFTLYFIKTFLVL